jgi:NAD(P)H-flavin reductase
VLVTVDQATRDWHGRVGVVPGLLSEVELDPRHTHALVCGPEIMMRFAVRALQGRGLEDDRIHLSLERNMKCAIGLCGHCQFGPHFVCKDGPVLSYERIRDQFLRREV